MKTSWDLVENKIKIENGFRIDVTDYISKMYKTRKNSILPYDINTEDVFEMLQDLVWTPNDKFVVFFNFEFVMCLMKLGITPDRITYIAPSKESFYVVRDYSWGERGMKSILFDLSIYNKYQKRKQWKSYLMKKLNKKDDFIVVGNIPFTINKNDNYVNGGSPIKVGNDFIELINKLTKNGKSVYILQAKFDTNTFQNKIIKNPNLKKIVFHKTPLFNIAWSIFTCHVVMDSKKVNNTFLYTLNDNSNNSVELDKNKKICLGRTIDTTYYIDSSKLTLGDLWVLGKKHKNQIDDFGNNKVITTLGSYKDEHFQWRLDSTEETTKGYWKVVLPKNQSGNAVKIAGPEYSIGSSIVALIVKDEKTAQTLKNWIISENVLYTLSKIRASFVNSKTALSNIILPNGLI